jgi:hypothetical protein
MTNWCQEKYFVLEPGSFKDQNHQRNELEIELSVQQHLAASN